MLFSSLKSRRREPEWMDEFAADRAELDRSLRYIRRINRLLGYARQTVGHLRRLSADLPANTPIRVLDVATGSADVPIAMLKAGLNVEVTGIDLHDTTLALAEVERTKLPAALRSRLTLTKADALALPFEAGSFDFVTSSLFLHHLDEDQIVAALREMDRVAARGVVVCDLLRHRRAYAWITLFTATAGPMVRHDARVSVAQALRAEEVLGLRDRAGLPYLKYRRQFGHRFALGGLKPLS